MFGHNFAAELTLKIEKYCKDKGFSQIADIENSYVFADEMEYPVGKKLPLWLCGFLY